MNRKCEKGISFFKVLVYIRAYHVPHLDIYVYFTHYTCRKWKQTLLISAHFGTAAVKKLTASQNQIAKYA